MQRLTRALVLFNILANFSKYFEKRLVTIFSNLFTIFNICLGFII